MVVVVVFGMAAVVLRVRFYAAPVLMLLVRLSVLIWGVTVGVAMAALIRLGAGLIVPAGRSFRLIVIGLARWRPVWLAGNERAPLAMLVVMTVVVFLVVIHFS